MIAPLLRTVQDETFKGMNRKTAPENFTGIGDALSHDAIRCQQPNPTTRGSYTDHFNDPITDTRHFLVNVESTNSILNCSGNSDGELPYSLSTLPILRNNLEMKCELLTFPHLLYTILRHTSVTGHTDTISWNESGRAFKIHDKVAFENEVMTQYFSSSRFSSFKRQLSLYQFKRVRTGQDKGCFYHEFFLRGRPDLVGNIARPPRKPVGTSASGRKSPPLGTDEKIAPPPFFLLPHCRELSFEEILSMCSPLIPPDHLLRLQTVYQERKVAAPHYPMQQPPQDMGVPNEGSFQRPERAYLPFDQDQTLTQYASSMFEAQESGSVSTFPLKNSHDDESLEPLRIFDFDGPVAHVGHPAVLHDDFNETISFILSSEL